MFLRLAAGAGGRFRRLRSLAAARIDELLGGRGCVTAVAIAHSHRCHRLRNRSRHCDENDANLLHLLTFKKAGSASKTLSRYGNYEFSLAVQPAELGKEGFSHFFRRDRLITIPHDVPRADAATQDVGDR